MINSACSNGYLDGPNDCFCELWMEQPIGPAAAYGARQASRRDANHLFSSEFFDLLYNDKLTTISTLVDTAQINAHASLAANKDEVNPALAKNIRTYVLFGDPEMKIWRVNPDPLFCPGLPGSVPLGPGVLSVQVSTPSNAPVPGALVSLVINGVTQTNLYADANGQVSIPINPAGAGEIVLRAYTDDLDEAGARVVIPVRCPADFNGSGVVSVQDIFDFLAAYFASDPAADFNGSGAVSVQDIFDYLAAYFAGCA
jgi:hypothetical protein